MGEGRPRTPNDILCSRGDVAWEGLPTTWAIPLGEELVKRANFGFDLELLPEGYGLVGGAARNVLEALAHPEVMVPKPRDIDVAFFSQLGAPRLERTEEYALSSAMAPHDTKHGYGIDELLDMAEWLRRCDFTINQVLVCGGALYTTTSALSDMLSYSIRPTIYEHNADHRLGIKLTLKAVRLLAEFKVDGIDEAAIRGIDVRHEVSGARSDSYAFWHTLSLDKALERGMEVAEEYLGRLRELGMSPPVAAHGNPIEVYSALLKEVDFTPSESVRRLLDTPGAGRSREGILREMGLMGVALRK